MNVLLSYFCSPCSGNYHPLGAVLFTKGTYTETVKIVDLVGSNYTNFSTGEAWTFDWKSGLAVPTPPTPIEVIQTLGAEYKNYSQFWQSGFAPFNAIGYKVEVTALRKLRSA
jgi:hypothetical protein